MPINWTLPIIGPQTVLSYGSDFYDLVPKMKF